MATLTVRDLDEALKHQLRLRAAQNGRSMEAEVRAILRGALAGPATPDRLGSHIHERFAALGGAEIEAPARVEAARAADLR